MSVSVITPVHGKQDAYASLIEEIGQHLAKQSVQPTEWLLVCDTSSTWLKGVSLPSFARVLVAPQNNISLKRNIALDEAKEEFVLFLDSDQRPETPELIADCFTKAREGYDILLIPEKFSYRGSYLKRCYHHLRGLYWKYSGEGVPRFFRRRTIGNARYDTVHLHFEDLKFYESVRKGAKEGNASSYIIHDEAFQIYGNLRKARIAQKQKTRHEIKSSFRLSTSTILKETPLSMLPGVMLILFLRTLAKRLLPVKGNTSR
ncbi:MAG: glycosyltransferase family 2 protein [Thaumarchaeota archaeon]|nr:glycosyltransferase family 2 protein [Nitrososphaerota archaeon]